MFHPLTPPLLKKTPQQNHGKTNPTPPPHKAQNKNKNKKQIIVGCIEVSQ